MSDLTSTTAKEEPITHIEIPEESIPVNEGDANSHPNEKRTLSDLAKAGFSRGELEMAKKQGLVEESNGDKSNDSGDSSDSNKANGSADRSAEGGQDVQKKEEKKQEKSVSVDERFRVLAKGKSPEQILAEVSEKGSLSPEQESALIAGLSQNGQALYWAQKKERLKRQKIEADLASERSAKNKEIEDLKAEISRLTKPKKFDDLGLDVVEEETDPNKKPLTKEDLDKIEAEKAEKAKQEQETRAIRSQEIKEALDYQEVEAKSRYADFDQAMMFTKEILQAANAGQLENLYSDARDRSRISRKVFELLRAFSNADSFSLGDYNAADMSYELAKEHPEFGKKLKTSVTKNDETGVDGDPEKVARIAANASRRGSSATLTGGGSRRVALDELTPEQAAKLPISVFKKLPQATRERLLGKR